MRRGCAAWLLVLTACDAAIEPPLPWSEPPSLLVDLRARVEPREVGLLQPITVTLDRFRLADVEVVFTPTVDPETFVTQSTTTAPERPLGNGYWQRTTMVLLPIAGPGEVTLPGFVAELAPSDAPAVAPLPSGTLTPLPAPRPPRLGATTPEQTITVTSVLTGHDAAIEAPGDPFPSPFAGWWWVAGAAGAVLLVVALMGWRSRRPARPHQAAVAVPAHVKALRELQRLRTLPRTTAAEIEAFYVQTSQVLRVYLEERFHLHAPERTTEEFLRDLEGGDQLARRHRDELERFLSQCDLVKFAAVRPGAAEHDAVWQVAADFVEATRADRAVEAVA